MVDGAFFWPVSCLEGQLRGTLESQFCRLVAQPNCWCAIVYQHGCGVDFAGQANGLQFAGVYIQRGIESGGLLHSYPGPQRFHLASGAACWDVGVGRRCLIRFSQPLPLLDTSSKGRRRQC